MLRTQLDQEYATAFREAVQALDFNTSKEEMAEGVLNAFFDLSEGKHPLLPGFAVQPLTPNDDDDLDPNGEAISSGHLRETFAAFRRGEFNGMTADDLPHLEFLKFLSDRFELALMDHPQPMDCRAETYAFGILVGIDGSAMTCEPLDLVLEAPDAEKAARRAEQDLPEIMAGDLVGGDLHGMFYSEQKEDPSESPDV